MGVLRASPLMVSLRIFSCIYRPIAGTTQAQRGLPTGAIVGIAIGAVVGLLLLIVLILLFLRRRRARARRHAEVAPPSPTLPLQNPRPDTQGSYFFSGYGNGSGADTMRDQYLAQSPPGMSQAPGPAATAMTRTRNSDLLPSSTFRDSAGSYNDTATFVSDNGSDVSLKMVRSLCACFRVSPH